MSPENYDDSVEPKRLRSIREIYDETEEVHLDEELMLIGIDEPTSYEQAAREHEWR